MGACELELTAGALVVALCADYKRRKDMLRLENISRRARAELSYINSKMLDAASEVVGEELAEVYIGEIGERIGYAYSVVTDISEVTYKINKRKVKEAIAKKLYLAE